MPQQRLDKLIAAMGRYSRREVKALAREGRITVNGRAVSAAEEKCDPDSDTIAVDGAPLEYRRYTYLMLHKPAGLLSATEDHNAPTVLDLLPPELRRRDLFPVGRLDKDTEGLLLLTNDGALAHRLLAPRSHVDKVYLARVSGTLTEQDVAAFAAGLTLEDGLVCLPARLELLPGEESVYVTVQEGKFHQVKRMLASRGAPVTYLKRLSMGPLRLDDALLPGQWRELTPEEERSLHDCWG